jgi:hypothetical protein
MMNKIGIPDAIKALRPGAQWVLRGNEYSGLEWLDPVQSKPTEQEVNDEIARLTAELPNKLAKENRARAYREEADPLFFKAQRGEIEQQEWLDKVAEIQQRYPYEVK